nr:MAG TPA: hypothetical protein [Caudoviricetes sp.]
MFCITYGRYTHPLPKTPVFKEFGGYTLKPSKNACLPSVKHTLIKN